MGERFAPISVIQTVTLSRSARSPGSNDREGAERTRSGPLCVADLAEVLAHGDRVGSLAEGGEAPGVLDGAQQAVVRFVRDGAESHDRSGRDPQRGHLASSRVPAAAG